jgi:hypothetical protein
MFGSSKRDVWGPEGLAVVSKSYSLFMALNKHIEGKDECALSTVEQYIPKFEDIDTSRFAYSSKWADEARSDIKSGGSFTLLFASIHNIQQSAKAIWACYAIENATPNTELAKSGLELYRGAANNCWINAQDLPRYGFKMSQANAAQWVMEMMPLFTTVDLWHNLSTKAQELSSVPSEWFPKI